jgi:hypothetical protein
MKKFIIEVTPAQIAAPLVVVIALSFAMGILLGAVQQVKRHQTDLDLCQQETGYACGLIAVPMQTVAA